MVTINSSTRMLSRVLLGLVVMTAFTATSSAAERLAVVPGTITAHAHDIEPATQDTSSLAPLPGDAGTTATRGVDTASQTRGVSAGKTADTSDESSSVDSRQREENSSPVVGEDGPRAGTATLPHNQYNQQQGHPTSQPEVHQKHDTETSGVGMKTRKDGNEYNTSTKVAASFSKQEAIPTKAAPTETTFDNSVHPPEKATSRGNPKIAEVDPKSSRVNPKVAEVDSTTSRVSPKEAEVETTMTRVNPKMAEVETTTSPKIAEVETTTSPNIAEVDTTPSRATPKIAEDETTTSRASPKVAEVEGSDDSHPCSRTCEVGGSPMTCRYHFVLEDYHALSKACYACATNVSDCARPHCVAVDGVPRTLVVVNRQLPGPSVEVCLGDRVVVDVDNRLLDASTSVHWHGHHQRGTPFMDGVPYVTQCPVPPKSAFRYRYVADTPGTHFWHSHSGCQRADGAFGAFTVRVPRELDAQSRLYDVDLRAQHTVQLLDWTHVGGAAKFLEHHHSAGDNKPDTILVNGKGRWAGHDAGGVEVDRLATFTVKQGMRYRFRLINAGFLNCPMQLSVDNHTLTVIASDGSDLRPVEAASLVSYAGERWDFVLSATAPVGSYWLRVRGLMDCDERFKSAHQLAVLHYEGSTQAQPRGPTDYEAGRRQGLTVNGLNVAAGEDDSLVVSELDAVVPDDASLLQQDADLTFYLAYDFYPLDNPTFHRAPLYGFYQVPDSKQRLYTPQLNHVSMRMPRAPPLSQPSSLDPHSVCHFDQPGPVTAASSNCTGDSSNCTADSSNCTAAPSNCTADSSNCTADPSNCTRDPSNCTADSSNCTGDSSNCTADSSNCTADSSNCTADSSNCTADSSNCTADSSNCTADSSNCTADSSNCTADSSNCTADSSNCTADSSNCTRDQYCACTHVLRVPLGAVVELVLVDEGVTFDANHPFHLHGAAFRVLGTDRLGSNTSVAAVRALDAAGKLARKLHNAPLKDTVTVPDGGYTVIRFLANNPGFWLFHCHIEFHVEVGMAVVFQVGEQSDLPPVPPGFPRCGDFLPPDHDLDQVEVEVVPLPGTKNVRARMRDHAARPARSAAHSLCAAASLLGAAALFLLLRLRAS